MTHEDAGAFAREWVRIWNAHDLEALLAHYSEDVTFTSPRAALVTGSAVVSGKPALRAYWGAAIARTRARRFTLERTVWDAHTRELVVVYISQVNDRRVRASEFFRFGADGLVVAGEAMYGAEV
jgi:ketosteroid isomerase-like protein